MVVGNTITGSLQDSLDTIVASARIIREQVGVMPNVVDRVTLAEGTGLTWKEIDLAKMVAQTIQETTELDNPQQFVDSPLTITPTVIGIQTLVTDRVGRRISRQTFARMGGLAQNAIQRKKDIDGLTAVAAATTVLGTANTSLVSGNVAAGKVRISSNTTEPGPAPYIGVFHGFHLKDFQDEIVAGVGTVEIGTGLTETAFRQGFTGMMFGVQMFEAGNMTIDSNTDATGGVFARMALILVQGHSPRTETRREPHIGGGATSVFIYDEYAYGERSSGNWLFGMIGDATVPTS